MFNCMRGLAGKYAYAQHYVNRDVTQLLLLNARHLLHDALSTKTRPGRQGLALFGSVNREHFFFQNPKKTIFANEKLFCYSGCIMLQVILFGYSYDYYTMDSFPISLPEYWPEGAPSNSGNSEHCTSFR